MSGVRTIRLTKEIIGIELPCPNEKMNKIKELIFPKKICIYYCDGKIQLYCKHDVFNQCFKEVYNVANQ